MLASGVGEVNPPAAHQLHPAPYERGKQTPRRPLTDAEVLMLLTDHPHHRSRSLVVLALYTSARIEEVCSLKKRHVGGDALHMREGKSTGPCAQCLCTW